MTVDEAKTEAFLWRLGALVLWAVSFLALLFVVAKSLDLYGDPNKLFVGRLYQYLRYYIELTQYHLPRLAVVWPYVPAFYREEPLAWSNLWCATPFIGIWIARVFRGTGAELADDVRAAEKAIRQEQLQESLRPGPRRSAAEIRMSIEIPRPSFWRALVKTWVAPLAVAVSAGLIMYLFGWN